MKWKHFFLSTRKTHNLPPKFKETSMRRTSTALAALFAALGLTQLATAYEQISPTLIRGTPVPAGTWQEVVRITSGGAGCTATIVGPRVIITAAHCTGNGATAKFTYKGTSYSAKMTRSPLYPAKDHDISVGVVASEITGAVPHQIGGAAATGTEITLLGYGCINVGGGGGNDGILRIGKSVITGFSGYDMVSRTPGGAALCYGDSGGPAFVGTEGNYKLLGINSKGNISDTNYNARLDRQESQDFLKKYASDNGVTICGINGECGSQPPPADPSCNLTANPSSLKVNESLSLVLTSQNSTSASIDGTTVNIPTGEKRITATSVGTFSATGTVRNAAGKTATCQASYNVGNDIPPPNRPTCTLTAIPNIARPNETITLEINVTGTADYASIDGNGVSVPVGKLQITRNNKGDYSATGFVRGTGGSANCFADYTVRDGVEPPVGEFAITPTHCGSNRLPESGVKSACIAIVKKDASWKEFFMPQTVLLTHADGTQEVQPFLARKAIAGGMNPSRQKEDLTVYANGLVRGTSYTVAFTQKATLSSDIAGSVPVSIIGRSAGGRYFEVENFSPFLVSQHLSFINPR